VALSNAHSAIAWTREPLVQVQHLQSGMAAVQVRATKKWTGAAFFSNDPSFAMSFPLFADNSLSALTFGCDKTRYSSPFLIQIYM
jgi:hypothetical protein